MNLKIGLLFGISLIYTMACDAQEVKDDTTRLRQIIEAEGEIKLNEEAVRSIRFNFAPHPNTETNEPEIAIEKPWMKFVTDIPKEFMRNEREGLNMTFELDLSLPNGAPQALVSFDADKILFENFTKRGRAIKRNRKHANAWKTYVDYTPTHEDSLKWFGEKIFAIKEKETPTDSLLHKDEIYRKNKTSESSEMIPMKSFTLEEYSGEYSKDY